MSAYNEEEYNKPLSLKIWAKMLPFLKPYRKEMLFIVALMTVSALIDVLFPVSYTHLELLIPPGM